MNSKRFYIFVGTAVFARWAALFIYKTSFVCVDGVRRFCLFDDAMISLRYAWNLSHGEGLVWNASERVEGITNFLWVVYMSVFTALLDKDIVVLVISISGVACVLLSALFTMKVGEEILRILKVPLQNYVSILLFYCALLYYPFNYWSVMGTELGMLQVLLLSSVWIALRFGDRKEFLWYLPFLLGLAFLTRPDAAIPAALVMLYRIVKLLRNPSNVYATSQSLAKKILALECSVLFLFVAGLTLFRFLYYGYPVPNTYILKVVGYPLAERISNGAIFVSEYLWQMGLLFAGALIAVIASRGRGTLLPFSIAVALVLYQVYVGGDAWNCWRLLSIPFSFVTTLAVVAIAMLVENRRFAGMTQKGNHRIYRWGVLTLVFAGGLIVPLYCANYKFIDRLSYGTPPMYAKNIEMTTNIAVVLSEVLNPTAVVGTSCAGVIPFYTGFKSLDFLENDSYIASLPPDLSGKMVTYGMNTRPGHNKYDLNYSIKKMKPTYVQTMLVGRHNMVDFVMNHYKRVEYKGLYLLLRKNSPDVRWHLFENETSWSSR